VVFKVISSLRLSKYGVYRFFITSMPVLVTYLAFFPLGFFTVIQMPHFFFNIDTCLQLNPNTYDEGN